MRPVHLLKLGVLAILFLGAGWLLQQGVVERLLDPAHIFTWVTAAGPLAPLLFIVMMALTVVISPIPSLPLDLAAGAAFGVVLGTTYSVLGAEIGAILSFLIGRALGRDALTRIFRTEIRFLRRLF